MIRTGEKDCVTPGATSRHSPGAGGASNMVRTEEEDCVMLAVTDRITFMDSKWLLHRAP
jgi:hypothetical protein